VGKKKHFYTVGGNVTLCNPYGKQYGVPQKLKIELPYGPGIILLAIYPKERAPGYDRGICISMFIAALLPVKFESCPDGPWLINGLRKCGIYIHHGLLFSHKEE
jgi:hypothetical protein